MKKILITVSLFLLFSTTTLFAQPQFNALLYTRTQGYHHVSINEGVDAIREIAQRHLFTVDWQVNPGVFSEGNLDQYDVIIFLNTTGDILNDEQQAVMEEFIQSGKGFVGIHAAADTEYDWEWYTQLVGRMFRTHPKIETAQLTVIDSNFPGFERTPEKFWWTDEWYEFQEETVDGLNYLLTIDESTYDVTDDWGRGRSHGMGDFHPLAWYHEFDGGRSFYINLGHMPESFADKMFREQIFGGILWAATGKGIE